MRLLHIQPSHTRGSLDANPGAEFWPLPRESSPLERRDEEISNPSLAGMDGVLIRPVNNAAVWFLHDPHH